MTTIPDITYQKQQQKQKLIFIIRKSLLKMLKIVFKLVLPIPTSFQYWIMCSPMALIRCLYSLASAKSCLLCVGSSTKYGTSTMPGHSQRKKLVFINRLKYLKLPSMKYRKERGGLIQLYNVHLLTHNIYSWQI